MAPFQLSSRIVTEPIADGGNERFSFHATVVETLVDQAATLRERFYSSGDPPLIAKVYLYVGKYPFVPLLQSRKWPVQKIWRLAKLHDHTVKSLHPSTGPQQ